MSLSALVNGAECGPVNPLQGLSKQLDRDRGIQQDHFGAGRAGPSRHNFRTQDSQQSALAGEANQFFAGPQQSHNPSPFDLSGLHGALRSVDKTRSGQATPNVAPAWAMDFNAQQPIMRQSTPRIVAAPQVWNSDFEQFHQPGPSLASPPLQQVQQPIMSGMGYAGMGMQPQFVNMQPQPQVQQPANDLAWVNQFASVEQQSIPAEPIVQSSIQDPSSSTVTVDDLSATAGLLISSTQHVKNPKFQNSDFMKLMRGLRDREVVVDGNDMVKTETRTSYSGDSWANSFLSEKDKGKGKAVDYSGAVQGTSQKPNIMSGTVPVVNPVPYHWQDYHHPPMQQQQQPSTSTAASTSLAEDEDFEDDFAQLGRDYARQEFSSNGSHIAEDWGRLQSDWDEFEATTTGIRPVEQTGYQFQANNVYMSSSASHLWQTSGASQSVYQTVLEKEALAQQNPFSARAWYELGVKQQENEQEEKAIQALTRSVQLDPTHLAAWIALAVSHTNENDRIAASDAIQRWVDGNEQYAEAVRAHKGLNEESIKLAESEGGGVERQKLLVECLMTMARMAPEGEVDADIQVALGVLLNISEEYAKAQDCFQTALAVRPDDWLLYNRVGATLANSGRASEALDYYYRALELNPSYIRARFNLGISCINLRMYEDAAQHILDALVLQENESTYAASVNGTAMDAPIISSSALWDSLKTTCLHLQRPDLVKLCEKRDLNAFRGEFQSGDQAPMMG